MNAFRFCLMLTLILCFSMQSMGQETEQGTSGIEGQRPSKGVAQNGPEKASTDSTAPYDSARRAVTRPVDPSTLRGGARNNTAIAARPIDPSMISNPRPSTTDRSMSRGGIRGAYSSNRGAGRISANQPEVKVDTLEDIVAQLQSMEVRGGEKALPEDWFVVGGSIGNDVNFDVFQGEQYVAKRVVEFIESTNNQGQWRVFHRIPDEEQAKELVDSVERDYRKWKRNQAASVRAARSQTSQRGRSSGRTFGIGRSGNC